MTAIVRPGDTAVFVGDSITQAGWMSVAGGLVDQINAQFPVVNRPRAGALRAGATPAVLAPGARPATLAPVATQARITAINSGIAGNDTADIEAAVGPRITDHNPDVVVILIGINDVTFGVPLATIEVNYDSILSQIRAWSATVQIVCISILYYGEQWVAGPAWDNFPDFDSQIDAANDAIRDLCPLYDATFIDARADSLLYEATHNLPEPGERDGILTQDGLHPNETGQLELGAQSLPFFTVIQ